MRITMTPQAYTGCVHSLGYVQGILNGLRDELDEHANDMLNSAIETLQGALEGDWRRDDVEVCFDEQPSGTSSLTAEQDNIFSYAGMQPVEYLKDVAEWDSDALMAMDGEELAEKMVVDLLSRMRAATEAACRGGAS